MGNGNGVMGVAKTCMVHDKVFTLVCPNCYAEAGVVEWRERQRKHEATHGWRNPPCIYEEQSE